MAIATALCLAATPVLSSPPASAVTATSPVIAHGDDWSVTTVPGGYRVDKTLSVPLEIRADAATLWADGIELGIATESLDGLTLTVTTSDPMVTTASDISQGWSGAGDPTVDIPEKRSRLRAVEPPARDVAVLADDPAAVGPYAVARYDYDLGDEAVEIRDFGRKGEMRAAVFMPTGATGERPVVVFLHGRHTSCAGGARNPLAWPCNPDQVDVESYLGYNDAATILASQGYAVISISANAINALDGSLADDTGAAARGQLVLDHLSLLRQANAGTAVGLNGALTGQLDLDNVGLMGHSRGGEGVMRAAVLNAELEQPFGITGVLPLAPTDYTRITVPGIPTATILPYCDGDVEDQMGQKYIDDSRHAYGDDVLRSSVLVMGTNHNYFNTAWTPGKYPVATSDDWAIMDRNQTDPTCGASAPTRLNADEQYAFGNSYIAAFFRLTGGGDEQFLPMFDGSDAKPLSAGRADVRVSATLPSSSRFDINNFTAPDTTVRVTGAGTYAVCESLSPVDVPGVLPYCITRLEFAQAPDWSTTGSNGKANSVPSTTAMHFSYTEPVRGSDAAGELRVRVPGGSVDASAYENLSFRVSPDDTVSGSTDVTVTLLDGSGGAASVTASEYGDALTVLPGSANPLRKALLQQIAVPVTAFDGVDLSDVREVRFTGARADGGVLLSDLAFLTASDVGNVELSTRPVASVPEVTVDEGNGIGSVSVPVVLSKPAETASTMYFTALGSGVGRVGTAMQKVEFSPGEICKAVTITIEGDSAASTAASASYVTNVSNTQGGATIGDAFGAIVLREDDGVTDRSGAPAASLPEVGAQGDACEEALAELGTLEVSPAAALAGSTVTVTGDGFRAGETVDLVFHSEPVTVGSVVSPDGSVSFEVAIPADAEVGAHEFVATGFGSGYSQAAAFAVLDPAAAIPPSGEEPAAGEPGAAIPVVDAPAVAQPTDEPGTSAGTDEDLAHTGVSVLGWVAVAVVLLGLGAALMVRRRRLAE
ncbi:hypothetical protein [Mycetocola zhujimingii]|uniref:hypothetical protein n=1 Tax=Mycetocola zhujimingii TaxID=2079792 RepID=UPI000D3C2E30|nr:hypothetical protein [Mycetocola zhujimingii]AWB86057.1 hypothetical protein C3E77_05130 [Mycetocola zhujimingii]